MTTTLNSELTATHGPLHLTNMKTKDIAGRGYNIVGYVLRREDGEEVCISAESAVRWLPQAHYWRLMHEQDESLFAQSPAAPNEPAQAASELADLWIHEDMDDDATKAILSLPRKELKAYFVQAREDAATWRRRALDAQAKLTNEPAQALPALPEHPHAAQSRHWSAAEAEAIRGYARAAIASLAQPGAQPAKDEARDAERLLFLAEEGCRIESWSSQGGLRYRLDWPDLDEAQPEWFATPNAAIDAALAASNKGEGK